MDPLNPPSPGSSILAVANLNHVNATSSAIHQHKATAAAALRPLQTPAK